MRTQAKPFARREAHAKAREARVSQFWDTTEIVFDSVIFRYLLPLMGAALLVYLLYDRFGVPKGGQPTSVAIGSLLGYIVVAYIPSFAVLKLLVWGIGALTERWARAARAKAAYARWADRALALSGDDPAALREMADASAVPDTRERAARAIADPAALRDLALNGRFDDARCAAALALSDQAVYVALLPALTDGAARLHIAQALTDQPTLAALALHDPAAEVRAAAVARVQDGATLARVALADSSMPARKAAVCALRDALDAQSAQGDAAPPPLWLACAQRALHRVALTDPFDSVRLLALQGVRHQHVLGKIALLDSNADLRAQAVGRLTDEAALAQVAFTEPSAAIRREAIRNIHDQQTLLRIAGEDDDTPARLAAVANMTDDALLIRLLPQAAQAEGLAKAIVSRLSQAPSLLPFALAADDDALALIATGRLSDQPALADVLAHAPCATCRALAASRISDPAALGAALSGDAPGPVRLAAAKQLGALDATPAVPALVNALEDALVDVRLAAAAALKRVYRAGQCRDDIAARFGLLLRPHADHADAIHTDEHTDYTDFDCSNNMCGEEYHVDNHTDETDPNHLDAAEIRFHGNGEDMA